MSTLQWLLAIGAYDNAGIETTASGYMDWLPRLWEDPFSISDALRSVPLIIDKNRGYICCLRAQDTNNEKPIVRRSSLICPLPIWRVTLFGFFAPAGKMNHIAHFGCFCDYRGWSKHSYFVWQKASCDLIVRETSVITPYISFSQMTAYRKQHNRWRAVYLYDCTRARRSLWNGKLW